MDASAFTAVGQHIALYFGYALGAAVALATTVVAGRYGLGYLKSLFGRAAGYDDEGDDWSDDDDWSDEHGYWDGERYVRYDGDD